MDQLLDSGAHDVFFTPIQMKKNRPAVKLSVLGANDDINQLVNIILKESTTLGVRIFNNIERVCLNRDIKQITTPWGQVKVKLASRDGQVINIAPEYEDCKRIAKENNLPLKHIYGEVKYRILE
jgi:uncharacterized protein (DUF111 family)